MQTKYRALSFIGLLLKIIGVLELTVGMASLIILPLVTSDSNGILFQFGFKDPFPGSALVIGVLGGVLLFLIGLVCGLLTFSAGELFNVFISIEVNTRASMLLLQQKSE